MKILDLNKVASYIYYFLTTTEERNFYLVRITLPNYDETIGIRGDDTLVSAFTGDRIVSYLYIKPLEIESEIKLHSFRLISETVTVNPLTSDNQKSQLVQKYLSKWLTL